MGGAHLARQRQEAGSLLQFVVSDRRFGIQPELREAHPGIGEVTGSRLVVPSAPLYCSRAAIKLSGRKFGSYPIQPPFWRWSLVLCLELIQSVDVVELCPHARSGKGMAAVLGVDTEISHHDGATSKIESIKESR